MTTPDYSTLDTAALVAAADALTAGITPGEWGWTGTYSIRGLEADNDGDVGDVIYSADRLVIDDDDAAFIAAAPALVKALVARLREETNLPPSSRFVRGQQVRLLDVAGTTEHFAPKWQAGTIVKVLDSDYYTPFSGEAYWRYYLTDGSITRWVMETVLEPVKNG